MRTISKLAMLALTCVVLMTTPGRAQVAVDIAKITCDQFALWTISDPRYLAMWLSGYYSGKRDSTTVDLQMLKDRSDKVTDYCRANPKVTLMQAVETPYAPGK
jgi:acid stress chaperone HdeB